MGDLLFFTRQGQVKRTSAADYDVRRAKFAAVMNDFVETVAALGENKRLEDLRCKQ